MQTRETGFGPLPQSRRPQRITRAISLASVALLALVACTSADDAQSQEEGFSNNDVLTIIVPASPGGGFDVEARLLQPHLEAELRASTGTNMTVRVENAPGAEARLGAQRVYDASDDDNLIWYYYTNTLVNSQMADGDSAGYDASEFVPLAVWGNGPSAIVLPSEDIIAARDLDELSERSQEETLLIGSTGLHREIEILARELEEAGTPFAFDIVEAEGTTDMIAQALRGNIELAYTTGSGLRPSVEEEPDLEFLASMACEVDPSIPDVPTIVDLGWPNAEEICTMLSVPRVFLGSPNMSDGKAEILENALVSVMSDDEFQDEAERIEHFLQPGDSSEAEEAVQSKIELYTN